jgi:hypothetical protein
MKTHVLERSQRIDCPLNRVFPFFADARNLDRLTPPWLHFSIRTPTPIDMRPGTRIEYRIRWHGLPLRWLTEIVEWLPERRFVDQQLRGPYRLWHHTHEFEADGDATLVHDRVVYALPFGPLGRLAHALTVRADVQRIFDYRARRIDEYFSR